MFTTLARSTKSRIATAILAAATLGTIPAATFADHRGDDRRDNHPPVYYPTRPSDRYSDRGSVRVDINLGGSTYERPRIEDRVTRFWVEPVYRVTNERVWVAAEYRTVIDRVWHETVVKRVCERVWVPDRYDERQVVYWERGCRVVRCERVLVERGHYENRERDVVITPAHYVDCPRQELVCEGHWATVERKDLVCAGHYEERVERVATGPVYRESSSARIGVTIPVRW